MKVYIFQVKATKSKEEALKTFESLKKKELPVRIDKVNQWYKVRIGNFKSYEEAKKFILSHGIDRNGYITLIDYDPSRTIVSYRKSIEKKEEKIELNPTPTEKVTQNEISNSGTVTSNRAVSSYSKKTNHILSSSANSTKFSNRTEEGISKSEISSSTANFTKKTYQNIEKKGIRELHISERKEDGMDFWSIIFLVSLLIVFLIITRFLFRKFKKRENQVQPVGKTVNRNLVKEDSRDMKKEKSIEKPKAKKKTQEVSTQNAGSIVSHGKLIIGESTSISGKVVSKDALIIDKNSVIKGEVIAEKYVKLGKNVRTGKIVSPIVHTIRDGELPKIPESEIPIAGGLKSNGDLELSDGLSIQGNVEVGGNLKIGKNSKIVGNVSAKSVVVDEGTFIYGKITSLEDVEIKNKVIVGSGPGKGGITAGGRVSLGSSVAVFGSIDAKEVIAE